MSTATETTALEAFRAVDFDWATRLQDVWRDPAYDVPELHARTRGEFSSKLAEMKRAGESGDAACPLGWVIVGSGGSGKTHLLGALRREAVRQRAAFVLVDMTDVHDFWDTLLQGYLDSLQEEYAEGKFQHEFLLWNFIRRVGPKDDTARVIRTLAQRKSSELVGDVDRVLKALHRRHPKQAFQCRDVVRALICLNSDDFGVANTGMAWLQAQEVDNESRSCLGFQKGQEDPRAIVKALSWIMSLSGPTIVAFDQLDPIVHQIGRHELTASESATEEQRMARAIIEQIGGGLAAVRDTATNTLSTISCVETTWNLLNEMVLSTYRDRFGEPIRLQRPQKAAVFEALIRQRLAAAYAEHHFTPPYPTWPFGPGIVGELSSETPREVLKLCEAHRKACLEGGAVTELTRFRADYAKEVAQPTDGFAQLDERFAAYRQEARPDELIDEKHEDERLAPLFQAALQCLVHEFEKQLPSGVDALVDREFSGGRSTKPLHARLRLVFHNDNSREEHYCVRALQRKNHSAYKTRLKAAMTQSGIDRALKFRHLTVVRTGAPPGGAETEKLTTQFRSAGGKFYEPTEYELRTLFALRRLLEDKEPNLQAWLQDRQPVTRLNLRDALVPSTLFNGQTASAALEAAVSSKSPAPPGRPPGREPTANGTPGKKEAGILREEVGREFETVERAHDPAPSGPLQAKPTPTTSAAGDKFPLGNRMIGLDKLGDPVTLPLSALARHTIILGGAGSGKTVTLRRLIEEAALRGIPSIIIDCARDMALFDEAWPEAPPFWRAGDAELARRFHETTEMIVWTPGRESGNPLALEPLPDFSPLGDDPEELEGAVQMVCDALGEIVAAGSSQKAEKKGGLLAESLRYFARQFPGGTLQDYIELLDALPPEAGLGLKQEHKLAEEMADSLKVEIAKNPLLRTSGTPLDPAVLFGDDRPERGSTRLSVISLVGLPSDKMQCYFLNQLAMLLFSWIKKNPRPPGDRAMRGLLVIDEAKDYVPSQKGTPCKESIMRLAAQARKYRLGLVFATQHPKDIETKVVGNCATHFYGLNNSPASLDTLRDLMKQKGGSGDDIPRLKTGQFYVHNSDAGHQQPIKVNIPISLSSSPKNPLEEAEILEKAKLSRRLLGLT